MNFERHLQKKSMEEDTTTVAAPMTVIQPEIQGFSFVALCIAPRSSRFTWWESSNQAVACTNIARKYVIFHFSIAKRLLNLIPRLTAEIALHQRLLRMTSELEVVQVTGKKSAEVVNGK